MKLSLVTALVLCGLSCSSETKERELSRPNAVPEHPEPTPKQEEPPEQDAPEPGPCEKFETAQFNLPDGGGTIAFRVPLPCDPLWYLKDRGDPPPMDHRP